jgi:N-acetyl-gamma-glutamyl-phosphate reductase
MHSVASVSIIGAAGYTGQETLDRVLGHPELELYAVGSDTLAGSDASALDPRLNRNGDKRVPQFITNAAALACEADVTFVCLPHEQAAALVPPARGIVVDLSGAHRLADPELYEKWYGFVHPLPDELGAWKYALPELAPPSGRLLANPGCHATAVLLALGPISGNIEPDSVVVDSLSGTTGAGRTPKDSTHSGTVLENVAPYRVGRHQHVPEIAQQLGFPVSFTPYLLPVRRGIISTCNVRSTGADLKALLVEAYADSPLVTVLPEGVVPELARVQGTDCAEIGVFDDAFTDRTIVVCAEDNLGKGAAGQAVQNVNLLFGLPETTGLRLGGVLV